MAVHVIRIQSVRGAVSREQANGVLSRSQIDQLAGHHELDFRPFTHAIESGNWDDSYAYLHEQVDLLRSAFQAGDEMHVLAVAPEVPHVIALGALLRDELPTSVYDFHDETASWEWPQTGRSIAPLSVVGLPQDEVAEPGNLVLRVEVSSAISDALVNALVPRRSADVRVSVPAPERGIVRAIADLQAIQDAVSQALAALWRHRHAESTLHLFVAAPVSVALAIGNKLDLPNRFAVQTYRFRAGEQGHGYSRAIALSPRGPDVQPPPLTETELGQVAKALEEAAHSHAQVLAYARHLGDPTQRWYDALQRLAPHCQAAAPHPDAPSLRGMLRETDHVEVDDGSQEYSLTQTGVWRFPPRLLSDLAGAAGGDSRRLQQLMRLFFIHEYLHHGQVITSATARELGRFPNCLERLDFVADACAFMHELDRAAADGELPLASERDCITYLSSLVELSLLTIWRFLPPAPLRRVQARVVRRLFNWYLRHAQIQAATSLKAALALLAIQPSVELAGPPLSVDVEGRVFLNLDVSPRGPLQLAVVRDIGALTLERFGETGELRLSALLCGIVAKDHESLRAFFWALSDKLHAAPPLR